MAIAITLEDYLKGHHAEYDVMTHRPTLSALRTAEVGHVPGDCLAKAVVLKDGDDFMVAVIPATHQIRLGVLSRLLGRRIGLAAESEADRLFADCSHGAFPAVAAAYGLKVMVDESLDTMPEIYFEGGDHESLVHMTGQAFHDLMPEADHARFSKHL